MCAIPTGMCSGSAKALRKRNSFNVAKQINFYCNANALSPAERANHKQLTDKLMAARQGIVEREDGYDFHFSPSDVKLAELADWVNAEGKCCPFFDFHIDIEKQGTRLRLRLSGEEGIKQFIRAEFSVPGSA